ncbi:MAG: hypothetical protein OXD01_00990 [Gammaproteobacteria bacterium]|nr:hypothetical protein [Gammaproteobacteria bacterium]
MCKAQNQQLIPGELAAKETDPDPTDISWLRDVMRCMIRHACRWCGCTEHPGNS